MAAHFHTAHFLSQLRPRRSFLRSALRCFDRIRGLHYISGSQGTQCANYYKQDSFWRALGAYKEHPKDGGWLMETGRDVTFLRRFHGLWPSVYNFERACEASKEEDDPFDCSCESINEVYIESAKNLAYDNTALNPPVWTQKRSVLKQTVKEAKRKKTKKPKKKPLKTVAGASAAADDDDDDEDDEEEDEEQEQEGKDGDDDKDAAGGEGGKCEAEADGGADAWKKDAKQNNQFNPSMVDTIYHMAEQSEKWCPLRHFPCTRGSENHHQDTKTKSKATTWGGTKCPWQHLQTVLCRSEHQKDEVLTYGLLESSISSWEKRNVCLARTLHGPMFHTVRALLFRRWACMVHNEQWDYEPIPGRGPFAWRVVRAKRERDADDDEDDDDDADAASPKWYLEYEEYRKDAAAAAKSYAEAEAAADADDEDDVEDDEDDDDDEDDEEDEEEGGGRWAKCEWRKSRFMDKASIDEATNKMMDILERDFADVRFFSRACWVEFALHLTPPGAPNAHQAVQAGNAIAGAMGVAGDRDAEYPGAQGDEADGESPTDSCDREAGGGMCMINPVDCPCGDQ